MVANKIFFISIFQSALPRRERRRILVDKKMTIDISIRAPAKGATKFGTQNGTQKTISIRAPAKGATKFGTQNGTQKTISIRAPAKGATCRIHLNMLLKYNFNPRSREGSDAYAAMSLVAFLISIRAPAKGATFVCSSKSS